MYKNYLVTAWRNLVRNKGYTLINILGLAIGLTCFILIILYVKSELGYDSFHEEADQIYRVALERKYPGRSRHYAIIPHSFAQSIEDDIPEVKESCRLFYFAQNTVFIKQGEDVREETRFMWADSTFFEVFSLPLLSGDPASALVEPNSLVLTESMAEKYFGQQWKSLNILGELIDFPQTEDDPKVTGVCADFPANSHMIADFLMSSSSMNFLEQPNYINFSAYTYLLLNDNAKPAQVEAKLPDLVTRYASGQILTQFGVQYEEYQRQGNGYRYFLQPLRSIYLNSNLESEMKPPGSRSRIYFFTLIAILIITIAGINFMNLSTARSATRAREVGIRKTMGSDRAQLVYQFLTEALIIAIFAGIIALVASMTVLPFFNGITSKELDWTSIVELKSIGLFTGLVLLVGLLSGLYPALFMSGFRPLQAIRGRLMKQTGGLGLRNALVVFQFGISVFLIISTMMVYRQLQYTQNKDLGFVKESVVTLRNAGGMTVSESETFKNELRQVPGILAVGGCSNQPGDLFFGMSMRANGAIETTTGSGLIVDERYIDCMKMNVVDGRSFSEDFGDSLSIMINESAVREMDLEDPVGKIVTSQDGFLNPDPENPQEYRIVGIVGDFHFQSLHHRISPLFLIHNDRNFNAGVDNLVTVRLKTQNLTSTLQEMENLWRRTQPATPFRYSFLDQQWAHLYDQEITSRKVFSLFSLLAIFIACLGLLALASYMTEQRIKEIGIRKILGASIGGIVGLLSKNFLKLVIVSIIIAVPLAYYFLNNWLNSFAYRTSLSWWVFGLAGVIALLIAGLTVSYTTIRAALSNPMNSLRNE
ncbi:MAG: ABC transporter permease [Saprospiraceae bacterium]|nr:ABC transporter permease [Saprospiraceae bacterium]